MSKGIKRIKDWRDNLLSRERITSSGLVWSQSLGEWIDMTAKQQIAVLDSVLGQFLGVEKYEARTCNNCVHHKRVYRGNEDPCSLPSEEVPSKELRFWERAERCERWKAEPERKHKK